MSLHREEGKMVEVGECYYDTIQYESGKKKKNKWVLNQSVDQF